MIEKGAEKFIHGKFFCKLQNGSPLFQSERLVIEVTDGKIALLHNKSAKRSDSGNYRVSLVNDKGSDSATCAVTVVAPPSPPEGPLEPVETTPESIKLRWLPPKDDGGAPVSNYIVGKSLIPFRVVFYTTYNILCLFFIAGIPVMILIADLSFLVIIRQSSSIYIYLQ